MADTQNAQSLNAWIGQLAAMQAMAPKLVIPGHMSEAVTTFDSSSLDYTKSYIEDFIKLKQVTQGSEKLIRAMQDKYPEVGELSSLELGAKVHTGEIQW